MFDLLIRDDHQDRLHRSLNHSVLQSKHTVLRNIRLTAQHQTGKPVIRYGKCLSVADLASPIGEPREAHPLPFLSLLDHLRRCLFSYLTSMEHSSTEATTEWRERNTLPADLICRAFCNTALASETPLSSTQKKMTRI
jgi:hypothetical protein